MGRDDIFNFTGVNVEATSDDHVLLAIDDVEEPFVVSSCHIASVEPSILKGLGGLLRLSEIALHVERTPHTNFTRFAVWHHVAVVIEKRDVQPRHGAPTTGQPFKVVGVVVFFAQNGDRHRAFGLAVELEEDRPHTADTFGQARRRNGRGAVENGFKTRQVVLIELGMIKKYIDHRRHQHRGGDAMVLHCLHELLGIKAWKNGK